MAKKEKKSKKDKDEKKKFKKIMEAFDGADIDTITAAIMQNKKFQESVIKQVSKSGKSKSRSRSRSRSKSPIRNVVAHGKSLKVNVGRSQSPPSRDRKVTTTNDFKSSKSNRRSSRSRSRSRSTSRDAPSARKSIKDRLGPLEKSSSSTSSSFKQDHWNGKSKPGKSERNGRDRGSKRDL